MSKKRPKLIFINGPVGAGKSTLAQRYIDNHTLALLLSSDDFVGAMGRWLQNEEMVRHLALRYMLVIAREHLKAGYDVVVPFLLVELADIVAFEQVINETDAIMYEIALIVPKDEAIARALERRTWGEPGAPPMTEADRPIIEGLYDRFENALAKRDKSIQIRIKRGDIEGAYRELLQSAELL